MYPALSPSTETSSALRRAARMRAVVMPCLRAPDATLTFIRSLCHTQRLLALSSLAHYFPQRIGPARRGREPTSASTQNSRSTRKGLYPLGATCTADTRHLPTPRRPSTPF